MAHILYSNFTTMKDTNQLTLRHIAGLYLDLYSTPRDLERPLTPEQVKRGRRLLPRSPRRP